MKKSLKVIGNIFVTGLMALMLILVFMSVSSKLSPDGTSKLGQYKLMVVLSGSMSPVFEAGDVIMVSAKNKTAYAKGDVISFKDPEAPNKVITHRIIEVLNNGKLPSYRTQGDANQAPDPKPVAYENIIGEQKAHIPYFGRVVEFAKTKQGLILLIIIPGVLIIADEIRSITRILNEEVQRKQREVVVGSWTKD